MMFEKNACKDHEVHFIVYANTKSLCCIPETNIMLYISDILIFLKKDANYLASPLVAGLYCCGLNITLRLSWGDGFICLE